MLKKNNEFFFAVQQRQLITDMLAGIVNAESYHFSFRDSSPNWLTRSHIQRLVEGYEKGLTELGAMPTAAHAPCGHSDHQRLAQWDQMSRKGHWRFVLADGRAEADLLIDGRLMINGQAYSSDFDAMCRDQQYSFEPCPCDPARRSKEHTVCRFFVWPETPDSKLSDLAMILFHFRDALSLSEDKRPRSAIREELLCALIALERLLMPTTVDEEIAKRQG